MIVVSAGNAFDGVTLYGPFDSLDAASDWAEREIEDSWDVVVVHEIDKVR